MVTKDTASNVGEKSVTVTRAGSRWGVIIFLFLATLKLNPGGYLDSAVQGWSWWLVTLPLWFSLAVLVVFLLVGGILFGIWVIIMLIIENIKDRRHKKELEKRRAARWAKLQESDK